MKLNKLTYHIIKVLLFFVVVFHLFNLTGVAQSQGTEIFSKAEPQAVEYLQKGIDKMEEALDTYSAHYPGRQLWAQAIDNAQQAIKIDPDFIEGHYYLALMYQYTGWYYREAEQWRKYLDLIERTDLTSPQVKQNLAHAYYRLGYNSYEKGDDEQSLIYFLNAIKEYPDLMDSNYWAARVFYETGDLENSLFYWKRVLDLDPYYPKAQYFYDKVEASIRYGKEAYNLYEEAYKEYENKNYGRAADTYRQAIRLNSNFADAYYWLARVYFETGDYRQAMTNYQKVLQMEPDNTKADYWFKETQRRLKANQ